MDCDATYDAGIILGYERLRAYDLNYLYDSDAVCLCRSAPSAAAHRAAASAWTSPSTRRPRRRRGYRRPRPAHNWAPSASPRSHCTGGP